MNTTTTIGRVIYEYAITNQRDIENVLGKLRKASIATDDHLFEWRATHVSDTAVTIEGRAKAPEEYSQTFANAKQTIYQLIGNSMTRVIPTVRLTSCQLLPTTKPFPAQELSRERKNAPAGDLMERAKNDPDAIPYPTNLDPNINVSKQKAYQLWWAAEKYRQKKKDELEAAARPSIAAPRVHPMPKRTKRVVKPLT